ncbi:olfactory receptor 10A7-like [Eublepharis macularius]|uniref:Olfactory receptor 10A7-like n=1 Tax=Eublepharis macularius TaxID=481883 RepID=A0AA97K4Q0_EUBMA|nr:olfactory receptor 10A7-like [Eublepharis macularius]
MKHGNGTTTIEFVLLGISNRAELQALFFIAFLLIYLFILIGNALVFVATVLHHTLRTPMYFFLQNLSFLDICFASVTLPQMLLNLMSEKKTISFVGCAVQMFFYLFLGAAVCYLLAIMSYDRYVAICHPLHYMRLMTRKACLLLVSGCWAIGLFVSLMQTMLIFTSPFCSSEVINHFFCDVIPLLRLHCTSPYINDMERILTIFLVLIMPFILILVSYFLIIVAFLKVTTKEGRKKALGTCSSHLVSVVLFYGSAMFTYLRPSSNYSPTVHKFLSLTYTVAPALLNPVIYSLRNKQMKEALRNVSAKCRGSIGF